MPCLITQGSFFSIFFFRLWITHTHSCPPYQWACRAATKLPHSCVFWASFRPVPQALWRVFSSPSTVRRQVFLGRPRFPLSLWCPAKHWLSSHHMSHPSPPPLHDDGAHAILVAAGEKILVGDGLRQEYSQDSLRFLVWKVDKLSKSLSVILQHSEPYGGVETTQLWHSLSLVLVLYSDKGPGRIFLDSADFRLI